MYILVEIIHTEFQYISLIEMQKYNWNWKKIEKRKIWKMGPFVPVGVTNRDKRSYFVPVTRPGTKGHPLLSRTGVPGWETGTTWVSQQGQINIFVVVLQCAVAFLLRKDVLSPFQIIGCLTFWPQFWPLVSFNYLCKISLILLCLTLSI